MWPVGIYPSVARCLTSLMYASLPDWGRPYMHVRISERIMLIFISGRRFYSSVMLSGVAHVGMYMYSYLLGIFNGVMRYKLHRSRQKKVAPGA